jgi:DNA polymerase-3 subunit beta
MKIECLQEKLQNAIKHAEKVVGRNLTLPILSTILFSVEEDDLKIRATNLNVGVEVIIPVKTEESGVVAVPGSVLGTILNTMKNDRKLTISSDAGNIHIQSENGSTTVKSHDPEDFPVLPKKEEENTFTLPLEKMIDGFKSVAYAAAVSDIKPEIASVYMYPDENQLVFVATDSFRLAEKKIKAKNLPDFSGVLIPIKNVQDILKVFSGDNGDVEVGIGENQITFSTEGVYLTSRLVDGVFPDYRQIIPQDFETDVTMLSSDVQQVLRMTDIFADKFRQVDVSVKPEDKVIVFNSQNADVGQNMSRVKAVIEGNGIDMSMNQKYLSDVFQSLSSDSLIISFVAANRPVVITGVGDRSFLYLIMPMNR